MKFYVALVTPFDTRGRVDLARLRAHVLWLAAQGVDGFFPTSTDGEYLYLSDREREAIHRTVLDAARDRAVYPCTWDPSPATTIFLTEAARDQGAAGVHLPPPVFYDLDAQAVREWFESVAGKGLPVLAHHDPSHVRTGVHPDVYAELRRADVLAGMLDSSGDLDRLRRMSTADPGVILAGDDRLLARVPKVPQLAGFVSAIANAWPSFCLRLFRSGEHQLQDALLDRVNRVQHAGGLRALKSLLRMGCRAPMGEPPDAALLGLTPAEGL